MSFVLGKITSVKRKVEFKLPSDDGKPAQKADFVATLKVRDAETVKARQKELQVFLSNYAREMKRVQDEPGYEPELGEGQFDEKYLIEDVEDITGLMDLDGNEIPFSAETLEAVLNDRSARAALVSVWSALNYTQAGSAQRKN